MESSLTDVFCYLMSGRVGDFCGRILASLEQRASRRVAMMAVGVRNRHFVLLYNPDWLARAHYDDVVATVRHEAYHIIFEHIIRHLEFAAGIQSDKLQLAMFHKASPFASDMAVNSLLIEESDSDFMREHRREWILPKQKPFDNYPTKMSFEWYTRQIMDDIEEKHKKLEEQLQQLLSQAGFNGENQHDEMYQDERDQHGEEDEDKNESGDAGDAGGEGGSSGEDGEEEEREDDTGSGMHGSIGSPFDNPDMDLDGKGEGSQDGTGTCKGDGDDAEDEEGEEGKAGGKNKEDGEEKEEKEELGLGQKLLENHRDWNDHKLDASPDDKSNLADELRYQTKTIVKKAVEDHEKACGNIPGGLEEVIAKLLKEPQIPWTRIFRNIVASARRTRRRRSLARPRRRHIATPEFIPFPGKKKNYTFHVAFLIDTSGSMYTTELEMALNELEGMRRIDKDMIVTVIEADAEVSREYQLGSEHDEIKYSVTGRGGTSFDPALRRAQELQPRCDAVFYFTDGEASAPHKDSRVPCPFAWIITPNGRVPDPWGMAIYTKPYE